MTEFGQIYFFLGSIFGQLSRKSKSLNLMAALNPGNLNLNTQK
jgi:hypothetical protein